MLNREVKILYEDRDILVCVKPHGMATQSKNLRDTDMERWVKNHLYCQKSSEKDPYVGNTPAGPAGKGNPGIC